MTQKAKEGSIEIVRHLFNRIDNRAGGLTVYANYKKGNSFFEVTTSVCSKTDMYNKKIGYTTCIQNFASGKSIRLPIGQFAKRLSRDDLLHLVDSYFYAGYYDLLNAEF